MLTADDNRTLTQVGPGTPMGELLRRYWHPIAGVSEFDARATKPVRILGEDLVLYKDLNGGWGLIQRHCPHRRADLSCGIVEAAGIRCGYHGWYFGRDGQCLASPYEDAAHPQRGFRERVRATAYPVVPLAGMLFAYLGPLPAPELPVWGPFAWTNGFAQVVLTEIPCNWLQAQENSIDPVHFEWIHDNWLRRLGDVASAYGPRHQQLQFEEFPHGFLYKRIKEDTDSSNPLWTVGRVCLWPNAFYLGDHFEYRIPIDDENMLSIVWKWYRVPRDRGDYTQETVPAWHGPIKDEAGAWITSHLLNQDFMIWAGQGRIADRTKEQLCSSDAGIAQLRRRFLTEIERVRKGEDPKGVVRSAGGGDPIELPMALPQMVEGFTTEQILASPHLHALYCDFFLQAGQPEAVRQAQLDALGLPPVGLSGVAP